MSLIIILLLILLLTAINLTYGFLKEGLNRRAIKGMFDQYVPPCAYRCHAEQSRQLQLRWGK